MTAGQPARWPTWLPWLPWTATLLLVAAALVLPANPGDGQTGLGATSWFGLLTVQALTFSTVGLVIARAQPRNLVAWLFAAVGIFVGLYLFAERYQHYALVVRSGDQPLAELAAWLQTWLYVPALGIFVTLLPQLFPTGRPVSRRWYPAVGLAGLACLGVGLADALRPGRLDQSTLINPVGITPSQHVVLSNIAGPALLLAALVSFASLLVRWGRADAVQRQQLKWFAYVASLLPLFLVLNALVEVFGLDERINVVSAFLGFLALPIATGISILRYRLYDIDRIISRTLVYGGLTVILLASYLALVLAFQLVLNPLTGQGNLAVAGSTLAVAALFRPLRARVQVAVDRRFYRRRYDAARTLQAFNLRLRDELDLEALTTDLRGVVQDTVTPAHMSLWLRTPNPTMTRTEVVTIPGRGRRRQDTEEAS